MTAGLIIPAITAAVLLWSLYRRVDIFPAMTEGARQGLKTTVGILPALVALLPGVYMLRASGAIDALTAQLSPLLSYIGMPAETVPLMLLRPLTGSGALAIGSDIIADAGADSFVGRCAAVMLGSTETTFYVIAVYFGAAKIKNARHTVAAALLADLAGFISAVFFVRLLF